MGHGQYGKSDKMKRTPLRRVSKKRAKQNREYSKLKKERMGTVCEVCWKAPAIDVHHAAGRIGKQLLDVTKWILVCRDCHRRIHDNPAWAREHGYLKPQGQF